MGKVFFSELETIYHALKHKCNTIINDDVWDKNDAIKIYSYLHPLQSALKKYPNWTYYDVVSKDMSLFEYVYNRLIFNDDLYAASDWIQYTLYNYANKKTNVIVNDNISIEDVIHFIDAILSKNLINLHKKDIAKIISGKIPAKVLYDLYRLIKFKTDNFNRLNESFYNPFDDDLLNDDIESISSDKEITKNDVQYKKIKKIKPYNNTSRMGNLIFRDNKVYANRNFFSGDIVEICPVRILHDDDLYSSRVRQIVFPIDLSRRIFGVPFGLSSIARCENQINSLGNVDYEYDPNISNEIKIFAKRNIKRGDEIIFVSDNKLQYDKDLMPKQIHPNEILKLTPIMK